MIEYPPGSGRYVMIVSPSLAHDLTRPITPEELAQMEFEDAIEDVIAELTRSGSECSFWNKIHRLAVAYRHVSDTSFEEDEEDPEISRA